ncbi:MAG TPA: hypothetical protein VLZ11_04360 [Flavobacterium sp.]|nr:hypothetical protein [Flavobacterium sp.]
MLVPFDTLPEDTRVWIYQSNRKFTDQEVTEIDAAVKAFVEEWTAHGDELQGSYTIRYNRFIVLAVNQQIFEVSGCSIDGSVRFIQSLEQKYGVDLLDKMNVTYKTGEFVAYKSLLDFKKMAKEKAVTKDTIVFNNLVNTLGEFQDFWEVPAHESWHNRFF